MLCHCSPCYLLYSYFILTQTFFLEKATPSFKISRTPSPFISVSYLFSLYIFSRSNSSIGRFLCILRNLPASSHLYCSAELSCLAQSIMVRSNTPTLPPVVYMSSSISTPTNICIVISSYIFYTYSSAIYQSRFDILRMNVIQIHYSVI